MRTIQEAHAIYTTFRSQFTLYRGALRLNRRYTLDRDAEAIFVGLRDENEAIRRLPGTEHRRIRKDIRHETETRRRQAARHSRRQLQGVREAAEQYRHLVDRTRRDVTLSMPDALYGLSADGMVSLALLRVQIGQALSHAIPAQLLATYTAALQRKDARACVECELIESIAESGTLATTANDRPAAKALRDYVDSVQEMRLPSPMEMPDFDDLLERVQSLDQRADAIGIRPTTDDEAVELAAYEAEHDAMLKAGEKSDADDQAAYRAELQAAGQ